MSSAACHCSTGGFSGRRANPQPATAPSRGLYLQRRYMYSTVWGLPVRRRQRTASPFQLVDSLFLPSRPCSWTCAPSSSTSLPPKALANTLHTGERLRGESDGLDWQTPGQLARTLPPTLRPRGPVLSLSTVQNSRRLSAFTTTPSLQRPPLAWPHVTRHHSRRPGPLSQRPRLESARPSSLKDDDRDSTSTAEQNSPSILTWPAATAPTDTYGHPYSHIPIYRIGVYT